MKRFLCLLALSSVCLIGGAGGAQEIPPAQDVQVQVAEVLRRGDTVTECGEGPRAAEAVAYAAAMAPPADDSHLWNVTLWTIPNCQACEHLKSDFRKAPELLAFVAPPSANALPWAHYTEYSGADATQADRRAKYKITRYPTLVVQPPRNGMWGDPGLIVLYDNGGYSDAKALAGKLQKAVRYFAEVQGRKGFPKVPEPIKALEDLKPMDSVPMDPPPAAPAPVKVPAAVPGAGQVGINPPFPSPPSPDPFNPQPTGPSQQPAPTQWPPAPAPAPEGGEGLLTILTLLAPLLGKLIPGSGTITALSVLILTGLKIYEIQTGHKIPAWLQAILGAGQALTVAPSGPTSPVPTVNVAPVPGGAPAPSSSGSRT